MMCRALHSKKVIVWAAMRNGQPLISPFFFNDESENSVIINAERYIATALRSFWTALGRRHGISREEEWLQQDGAVPYTAQASLNWMEEHFPERHISLKIAVPWAPHLPDLSPLVMVWGVLKDTVYINKPGDPQELKATIRKEMRRVTVDQVDRTIQHLKEVRLSHILHRRGAHLEHLLWS